MIFEGGGKVGYVLSHRLLSFFYSPEIPISGFVAMTLGPPLPPLHHPTSRLDRSCKPTANGSSKNKIKKRRVAKEVCVRGGKKKCDVAEE